VPGHWYGTEVDGEIIEMAKEYNCSIIGTPHDTFIASRLICQAIPVKHVMASENIISFSITDYVDDVKDEMTKKRFRYFPVHDTEHNFLGMCFQTSSAGIP
jgi:manganese-dependent inorganic pyrophosphatase